MASNALELTLSLLFYWCFCQLVALASNLLAMASNLVAWRRFQLVCLTY